MDSIPDYTVKPANMELSKYGGWKARRFDQGTGFFRVQKVNGRWWAIDPEGYLFMHMALNSVNRDYATPNDIYSMMRSYGFNGFGSWSDESIVKDSTVKSTTPLAYTPKVSFIANYRRDRVPQTDPRIEMPVFDDAFVTKANQYAQEFKQYANDPHVFGFMTDNELDFNSAGLASHLAITDPLDKNYLTAINFLTARGKTPTTWDGSDHDDYMALMAERYYSVVHAAIRSVDTQHMIIGSRCHSAEKGNQAFMVNAGKYVDVFTANHYNRWSNRAIETKNMSVWSGRPVILTEFYTMSSDGGMSTTVGAGWHGQTQADRGLFYQNFVSTFAESGYVIGVHWFKYNEGSNNTGVINSQGVLYTELLNSMKQMNIQIYDFIDYADSRHAPDAVLGPVADAYFEGGTNRGTNPELKVKLSSGSTLRQTYLRFDVSTLAGNIGSAKIQLYSITGGSESGSFQAELVSNDTWGETTITSNNEPPGSTVLHTWSDGGGDTVIDVTAELVAAMASDDKLSIRVVSTLSNGSIPEYGSRENPDPAARPKLMVYYPNVAPVASNDVYATIRNTPLTVIAPGVLANDSDAESDPLSAVLVDGPASGTLALNTNGSFTYTPANNFTGVASFTYKTNDGDANSPVVTVSINVRATNTLPSVNAGDDQTSYMNSILVPPSASATLDGTVTDANGDVLVTTWTKVSGPAAVTFANASSVDTTVSFAAEGTYTLRLTASDGFGSVANDCVVTVEPDPRRYLTYQGNGSTGGSAPVDASSPYNPGSTVTVLGAGSLVKTGHSFAGWNTAANGGGTSYATGATFSISSNTTLYAQWSPILSTVTFDANGGNSASPSSKQVSYGSAYGELANSSRAGYTLKGWFTAATGGTQVTSASTVTAMSNHTLYAQWTTGVSATAAAKHYIRGESENNSAALGYFESTSSNAGTGGTGGARDDRNPIFAFTLPTLPMGASLESASFQFEISSAFDSTGGGNLPGLHVYLLNTENPVGTGTSFYYHGNLDPSANARRIGTTSVTISGTTSVSFPAGQEVRTFSLSGDALTLLKSYYNGHTPTRSTVYLRFNLSVDPIITSYRRYAVNTASSGSSLQLVSLAPPNRAPTWVGNPITGTAATEGQSYSGTLAGAATDLDGQALTFTKVSGPAWLNVAADGALTGTPGSSALGDNSFIVRVSDGASAPVETTLQITVQNAFESWVNDGGGGDITFGGDVNHDGVADGLAWLLGSASPSSNAIALKPTGVENAGALVLNFRLLKPGKRGSAVLSLQCSRDLGITDPWSNHNIPVPDSSGMVDGVVFDISPASVDLNQVQATVPASAAGSGGNIFVRLGASP